MGESPAGDAEIRLISAQQETVFIDVLPMKDLAHQHTGTVNAATVRHEQSQDSAAETGDALIRSGTALGTGLKRRKIGLFAKRILSNIEPYNGDYHGAPRRYFTLASQIRGTLLNSWVNLLLLIVPGKSKSSD